MRFKKKKALYAAGLLLLVTLAAYANTFHSSFHFDDEHQVVKNQHIRSLDSLTGFFTDPGAASYDVDTKGYRPLTYMSFALNHALGGYNVPGYHLFNISLHFINAFLVFIIMTAVLERAGYGRAYPLSLAGALLFAVHPVGTSAVTYISGRAAVLASFFWLAGLWSFLRFRAGKGGPGRYAFAVLAPVFYLLGLFSKEMAVSLPAVFLAYDLIFPDGGTAGRRGLRWLYYAPFVAVASGFFHLRKTMLGYYASFDGNYTPLNYLLSEAKAFPTYLRLMVLPFNQNADYNVRITVAPDMAVVASSSALAAILFALYRLRRSNPAAAFFGFWFFIALAPESSVVPIWDIIVEYRLYLPSAGFIAALLLVSDRLPAVSPAIRKAGAVLAIVMLGLLAFNRNSVWATETTLWADVLRKSPGSMRAYANYGNALLAGKKYNEAMAVLTTALRADPCWSDIYVVHNNLGVCLIRLGMYSEALGELDQATRARPGTVESYGLMGLAYYETGRYREAVDVLQKAVMLNPGYSNAHVMLSDSYSKLGRKDEALKEGEAAVHYAPKDFAARYNMARLYMGNGMVKEAAGQADLALELASGEEERKKAAGLMAGAKSR